MFLCPYIVLKASSGVIFSVILATFLKQVSLVSIQAPAIRYAYC